MGLVGGEVESRCVLWKDLVRKGPSRRIHLGAWVVREGRIKIQSTWTEVSRRMTGGQCA